MIDTKALRSKVLDLAIQGKLTEQLESDGTAEELFAQIQEEKQKLIKEGRIKKEKPLPPVSSEEIPFEIPRGWMWVRLSDIGYTNIGLTYHPCDISEKGTLVIRSSNIKNGKMDYADKVFVNCSVKNNQYLQKNDIIICARNGSKALVGKNAIFDGKYENVAFGAFMAVFRTSFFQYVYIYFNTDSFKRYFSNDDSKQINQVTQAILKESVLPLPPLAEQKRIVERVEEIFKLLDIIDEAQKKYSADAEILKSKLITMGIQGKLTEQLESDGTAEELYQQIQEEKQKLIKEGKIKNEKPLPPISPEEIPFEIPGNWKWVRLSDIGSTNIGLTYHPSDIAEKGTLVIRSSNIQNGKMDYSDKVFVNCPIKDNQFLQTNDIVICARNGSKALVGKNAIFNGKSNEIAFGAFMAVFRTKFYSYVHLYLNTQAFKRYYSNDDSKQINQVTQAILKEAVIPLPPLAEQKRIAEKLDMLLSVIGS